jgi:hypothetical protein
LNESRNWRLAGMLNKVPEVTLAFWVIKIMSTTVGETGADYLVLRFSQMVQLIPMRTGRRAVSSRRAANHPSDSVH